MHVKRSIIFALALWTLALTFAVVATPAGNPTRTVERLTYARLAPSVPKGVSLVRVECLKTTSAYIYVCAVIAKVRGQLACQATYVHYNPRNRSYGRPYKVNLWNGSWSCESPAPIPPPSYPGDGGPPA